MGLCHAVCHVSNDTVFGRDGHGRYVVSNKDHFTSIESSFNAIRNFISRVDRNLSCAIGSIQLIGVVVERAASQVVRETFRAGEFVIEP